MLPLLVLIAGLGGLGSVPKLDTSVPVPVTFKASDGVTIYANSFHGGSAKAPVILLFHQADSSKNEYSSIASQLVHLGYNVVAIDQRSGGDLYPPPNETVQHLGRTAGYLDVLADLDATLAYARRAFPGSPVYAWGSSYSAGLVFVLAAKHPGELAAVLAFSPAEYFDDKQLVERAAHDVRVPVFIDSASVPSEEAAAGAIFRAVSSRDKVQYRPKTGIHGSSTLRTDRDAAGASENWDAVIAFLSHLPKSR